VSVASIACGVLLAAPMVTGLGAPAASASTWCAEVGPSHVEVNPGTCAATTPNPVNSECSSVSTDQVDINSPYECLFG
jgi:hypothetical protein